MMKYLHFISKNNKIIQHLRHGKNATTEPCFGVFILNITDPGKDRTRRPITRNGPA